MFKTLHSHRSTFVSVCIYEDAISTEMQNANPPLVITPTSPLSPLGSSIIVSSSSDITVLDRHFEPTKTWTAWDAKGRATALVEAGGLLVGVGEDEKGFPVLKIWDLTRDEKKANGSGPVIVRNVRIQHGSRRSLVSLPVLGTSMLVEN
jgi:hypothetical protein